MTQLRSYINSFGMRLRALSLAALSGLVILSGFSGPIQPEWMEPITHVTHRILYLVNWVPGQSVFHVGSDSGGFRHKGACFRVLGFDESQSMRVLYDSLHLCHRRGTQWFVDYFDLTLSLMMLRGRKADELSLSTFQGQAAVADFFCASNLRNHGDDSPPPSHAALLMFDTRQHVQTGEKQTRVTPEIFWDCDRHKMVLKPWPDFSAYGRPRL